MAIYKPEGAIGISFRIIRLSVHGVLESRNRKEDKNKK
jgi:hypothetical protein